MQDVDANTKRRITLLRVQLHSGAISWAPRMHTSGKEAMMSIDQCNEYPRLWQRVVKRGTETQFEWFIDAHPVPATDLDRWAELLVQLPEDIEWTVPEDPQMRGQRQMLEASRNLE